MNEKIKALAIKSGAFTWSCGDEGGMNTNWLDPEKFAELIVKECMQVANEYQNRGGNCYVDNMIAKHFGVEE
jgi:hypothetical protein